MHQTLRATTALFLHSGGPDEKKQRNNLKQALARAARRERLAGEFNSYQDLQDIAENPTASMQLTGISSGVGKSKRYRKFAIRLPTVYQKGEMCLAGPSIGSTSPLEVSKCLAATCSASVMARHSGAIEGIDFVARATNDIDRDRLTLEGLRTLLEVSSDFREVGLKHKDADGPLELLNATQPFEGKPEDEVRIFRLYPEGIMQFAPLANDFETAWRAMMVDFEARGGVRADLERVLMHVQALLSPGMAWLAKRTVSAEVSIGGVKFSLTTSPADNDDFPQDPAGGNQVA